MNREDMTRCMRDGCTYQQIHEINDYIDSLEQENKQLKEQNEKLRIVRVDYECFTENSILIDNYTKTRLEKNKYLIECNDGKFVDINTLERQLKQRDEVIDEANNLITNYLCSEEYCNLNVPLIADFFMNLQHMLQKYKGDSNEKD